MKYILNDSYNGDLMVTQCGKIFNKLTPTDILNPSFEVEQCINQKFIVPFREEVSALKKELAEKQAKVDELTKTDKVRPKGVSTVEVEEESFKEIAQEIPESDDSVVLDEE